MSGGLDEPHEWPMRDWASRLRPPGGGGEPIADQPALGPEALVEVPGEVEEPGPAPGPGPGPEVLYEEPALGGLAPVAVEEHAAGEFHVPGGYTVLEGVPAGRRRAVAVVVSRFNGEISNLLLRTALDELAEAGVPQDAILVMPVPGAFELPIAAMALAKTRRYACVVALGCVIRGETPHFEFVASEAASGLQLAAIETGVPVAFGVLTCDTLEQARARAGKGAEAARTALEMADVFAQLRAASTAG